MTTVCHQLGTNFGNQVAYIVTKLHLGDRIRPRGSSGCYQAGSCVPQTILSPLQVLVEASLFDLEVFPALASLDLGLGCANQICAAADVFLPALVVDSWENQAEVLGIAAVAGLPAFGRDLVKDALLYERFHFLVNGGDPLIQGDDLVPNLVE